jgi:hypothetical protein
MGGSDPAVAASQSRLTPTTPRLVAERISRHDYGGVFSFL